MSKQQPVKRPKVTEADKPQNFEEPNQFGPQAQTAAPLAGETFNAKLRALVSDVKQGLDAEGVMLDFKHVFHDTVRKLQDDELLNLVVAPLATEGGHGTAFFQLFAAGPNGENLLRFCQQELGMELSEARTFLTPPKTGRWRNKEYDEMLPLSLESASPWLRDFVDRHWNVPDTQVSLVVRHTAIKGSDPRISVGIAMGFEPLRAAPSTGLVPVEKRGLSLPCELEHLRPLVGVARNLGEMAQVFLCFPTACRKHTLNIDSIDSIDSSDGLAALSAFHLIFSGAAFLANVVFLADKSLLEGISDLVEWNDLSTIGKYGAIVCACNLASSIYEWGYAWYEFEQEKRGNTHAP